MPEFDDLKPCKRSSVSTRPFVSIKCMSLPMSQTDYWKQGLVLLCRQAVFFWQGIQKGKVGRQVLVNS